MRRDEKRPPLRELHDEARGAGARRQTHAALEQGDELVEARLEASMTRRQVSMAERVRRRIAATRAASAPCSTPAASECIWR